MLRFLWVIPWLRFAYGAVTQINFPDHGLDNVLIFLGHDIGLRMGSQIIVDLVNHQPQNDTYLMIVTSNQQLEWLHVEPFSLPDKKLNSYLTAYYRENFYDRLNFTTTVRLELERYLIAIMNPRRLPLKVTGNITTVYQNQYLRVQDEHLPEVYFSMMLLFLFTSLVFGFLLLTIWRHKKNAMHVFLLAVLSFKAVVLFLKYCDLTVVSVYGQNSTLGEVVPQLLDKVQGILELLSFLLIALGWKVLRTTLNITEIRFTAGIAIISFYLGVFEVSCTSQASCSGYKLARYILHSLCFLVIIVVMNYNVQMIYSHIADSPASVETGKLYQKHQAFRSFRWVFLFYIILPTVLLFVKISIIDWTHLSAYELLKQIFMYLVTVTLIVLFRPGLNSLPVFQLTRDPTNAIHGSQ